MGVGGESKWGGVSKRRWGSKGGWRGVKRGGGLKGGMEGSKGGWGRV